MAEENGNGFDKGKVLERIRKMLALADTESGATEGERDNALRMIHATLAKYNLSLAEAELEGMSGESRVKSEDNTISPNNWARTVAAAIADLYFCEYFYTNWHNGKITHYFIGREGNTITTRETAAYVVRSIQKEARRKKREAGVTGPWERSFCNGAAHRIYLRCAELRRAAEKPQLEKASTGTALVLASVYASEEVANKALLPKNLKKGRRGEITDHRAAAAGYEYGSTINLNRAVGNNRIKGRLT